MDSPMETRSLDEPRKGVYLFGRDISQIPCFRNSLLYGISGGIGVGLVYFMFTSKVIRAVRFGSGASFLITNIYWFSCRYNYSKTKFELLKVKDLLEKKLVVEGTAADLDFNEMEKIAQNNAQNDKKT